MSALATEEMGTIHLKSTSDKDTGPGDMRFTVLNLPLVLVF